MSAPLGEIGAPEEESRQLRPGHGAGGDVGQVLAFSVAHILRPSSLERGLELLGLENRSQGFRRCVVIQNGRSEIGQGVLPGKLGNGMVSAFVFITSTERLLLRWLPDGVSPGIVDQTHPGDEIEVEWSRAGSGWERSGSGVGGRCDASGATVDRLREEIGQRPDEFVCIESRYRRLPAGRLVHNDVSIGKVEDGIALQPNDVLKQDCRAKGSGTDDQSLAIQACAGSGSVGQPCKTGYDADPWDIARMRTVTQEDKRAD